MHSLSQPGSFVTIQFSIFIAGPCYSMQSFVATCSCSPSWIPSRQSFLGRNSILFFNIFILSRQSFLCRNSLTKSVFLSILCRENLMCGSLNSYVATSKIFIVIEFLSSFFKLVSRSVFMSRQHFCFCSCCNKCFLYC